ncbi:hypothetical protein ACIBEJ_34875 [Nonomuraea sp. NPDC050790]|uniref:hypothetical protein n=1 Tax=Nonomuraea sp. NPDC050790 TaxID=3364371 RepID=UPI0037A2476F
MPEIDEFLTRYLAARDADRDERVNRAIEAMTVREHRLVHEAAVMGYMQGVQAARVGEFDIPMDAEIVWRVIAGCQTFGDIYPTISGLPERASDG